WVGNGSPASTWNHTALSWNRVGLVGVTNFNDGDVVTFDDTTTQTNVTIAEVVLPATNNLVNFLNQNNVYTLLGSGSITGATGLKVGVGNALPSTVNIRNNN